MAPALGPSARGVGLSRQFERCQNAEKQAASAHAPRAGCSVTCAGKKGEKRGDKREKERARPKEVDTRFGGAPEGLSLLTGKRSVDLQLALSGAGVQQGAKLPADPLLEVLAGRGRAAGWGPEDSSDEEEEQDEEEGSEAQAHKAGKRAGGGRGRGARRSQMLAAFSGHSTRLVELLNVEFDAELQATEERLREWAPERLVAEGYVLFGLVHCREQDLQNTTVFRFQLHQQRGPTGRPQTRPPGPDASLTGVLAAARARRSAEAAAAASSTLALPELPFHRFMAGDMVAATLGVAPPGGDNSSPSVTGVVLERGPAWVKVAVSEGSAQELMSADGGGTWRLDLAANGVAHERMVLAMTRFTQPGGMPQLRPDQGEAATTFTPLQRALLGTDDAAEYAALQPPWMAPGRSGKRAAAAAAAATGGGLNDSQRSAVAAALQRTFTQWQGPPGTGKTRTLLAFIKAMVTLLAVPRRGGEGKGKGKKQDAASTSASGLVPCVPPGPVVLACAPSNVAADALVEGLLGCRDPAMRVVRLGSPAKVASHLRNSTLFAAAQGHPGMARAKQLRSSALGCSASEAAGLRRQARDAEAQALSETLLAADVVVATCSGAGDEALLGDLVFACVVVDEATQATEPGCMVPLVRGATALLVGDAKQLPPTVVSLDALAGGLATSLAERLQAVCPPLLLDTQYRMHPSLAAFPSAQFYASRLRSAPSPGERMAPRGFPWPEGVDGADRPSPLAFVDVPHGQERRVGEGDSVCNPEEAALVAHVVALLLSGGDVGAAQIGVVTPYSAQVALIQRALRLASPAAGSVSVRSVDGFQGQEREVIVFSCVRANAGRQLGFTADGRRLNVAITRAKRGLIVCGHRHTLGADPLWRAWLGHVDQHRAAAPMPPLHIDDALLRAVRDDSLLTAGAE